MQVSGTHQPPHFTYHSHLHLQGCHCSLTRTLVTTVIQAGMANLLKISMKMRLNPCSVVEIGAAEPLRSGARSQGTIYWSVILRKSIHLFELQFVIYNMGSGMLSTSQGCSEDLMAQCKQKLFSRVEVLCSWDLLRSCPLPLRSSAAQILCSSDPLKLSCLISHSFPMVKLVTPGDTVNIKSLKGLLWLEYSKDCCVKQ